MKRLISIVQFPDGKLGVEDAAPDDGLLAQDNPGLALELSRILCQQGLVLLKRAEKKLGFLHKT